MDTRTPTTALTFIPKGAHRWEVSGENHSATACTEPAPYTACTFGGIPPNFHKFSPPRLSLCIGSVFTRDFGTNAPRSPPLRCLGEVGKFFSGTLCSVPAAQDQLGGGVANRASQTPSLSVQGDGMCQPAGIRHPQQVPCKPAPVPPPPECRRTPDMCPLL